MTRISVDLMDVEDAVRQLESWKTGTLDPATDFFVGSGLAQRAKEVMRSDAHGPQDNPENTGGLHRQIETALVQQVGNGHYTVTVQEGPASGKFKKTDPAREAYWGNKPHGMTPPPHDFTRNVNDELKSHAKEMWDADIKGML